MTKFTAGKFTVNSWEGGYPVWCQIEYDGKELGGIHHSELRDLAFCLARILARLRHDPMLKGNEHELD